MRQVNKVDHTVHLSYKDVLLVPYDEDFCSILSRNDPDISTEICPGKTIGNPLISAPMDSVTGFEMMVALSKCGSLGVLTRHINKNNEKEIQVEDIKRVKEVIAGYGYNGHKHIACAIGVKNGVVEHSRMLCDAGVNIICLDIANGNHIFMQKALENISKLKDRYDLSIIAGNVATPLSAQRLIDNGADTIKIGIGPGAACTTRRVVGFGVPQFTAVLNIANAVKNSGVKIIADGGVRNSGDAIKAIWAGADTVMSGYVFAGHNECPTFDGKRMYRGMSSRTVHGRSDVAAEGVCMEMEEKGPICNTVQNYCAAIKAACSMANARNLNELRQNVRAVRVSTMSNEESEPVT